MPRTKSRRKRVTRHSRKNEVYIRKIISLVKKLRTKKLSPEMLKMVKRHRKTLRLLSNPRVSMQRKHRVLVQRGGELTHNQLVKFLCRRVGIVAGLLSTYPVVIKPMLGDMSYLEKLGNVKLLR